MVFGLVERWRLSSAVRDAKRRIRELAIKKSSLVRISSRLGATPERLVIWIGTRTDAESESLRKDPDFVTEFRNALLQSGYPADAVPFVHFDILSQETVDRDYAGRWAEAQEYP